MAKKFMWSDIKPAAVLGAFFPGYIATQVPRARRHSATGVLADDGTHNLYAVHRDSLYNAGVTLGPESWTRGPS
jgi:hypothetical protein